MNPARKLELATRYVAWLRRRWLAITLASVAALLGSAYLIAFRLPLYADFSYLLPPDAPAVRDLRRLEARVEAQDAMLVLVVAKDPQARAAAAADMVARARTLDRRLVTRNEDDAAVTRDFLRARRHLFVPLEDLRAARDALQARIDQAKLEANPLYVPIDDEADAAEAEATAKQLEELRARRRDAEARLDRSSFVSADGETQLIIVRTSFPKTNVDASRVLLDALERERGAVLAAHPGVDIGFAGGNVVTLAEHDALQRGIVLSTLVTAVLVALVLFLYFRSLRLLMALGFVLVTSTTIAFGLAVFTVGHLNAATAFLGAIIAGNGVNYGLLLIARYLEERRRHEPDPGMARALAGTLRPTLVASLGAAIAYGSLAATSFRGFADFAIIGSVGMLVCWIVSFITLPALVLRFVARPRIRVGAPVVGSALAWLLAFRHPWRVVAVAVALAGGGAWVTYGYIAADPFEYNIRNLRSAGDDAVRARVWMDRSDVAFGRGITGQIFFATENLDEVREVVAALERIDRPGRPRTIGKIRSILEVLPDDQPAKLEVLAAIREQLDDDALEALPDDQLEELMALRPPDELEPITIETLPEPLLVSMRERDGRIGLLIGVRPDLTVDEWNGKDLLRFAHAVRRIELPDGRAVTTSGASVVFADIHGEIAQAIHELSADHARGAGRSPSRRATLAELCNTLETIDFLETKSAPVVSSLFLLSRARELANKLAAEEGFQ
jgi:preprotein translocase subunit SecF